ncbi:MAG: AI-2E family transporter [Flavobacteriales bacterium]|nr:AI-2E family transporter [Flavobacteriales bacterium]
MDHTVAEGQRIEQPPYQKLSIILLGLAVLVYGLYVGASIIVPMMFALLLAMLLNPFVTRLQKWRFPRILAITIAVLFAMFALAGLAYFIGTQAAHFSESLPQLKQKLNVLGSEAEQWAQDAFNMRKRDVTEAVEKVKNEGMEQGGSLVGTTLTAVGTLFAFFFLLPVFTFLLLLYKRLLLTFIAKLFPPKDQDVLQDVLKNTKGVVQSYLVGLILEAGIVATLNWVGLLIIGVEYALLLAVIGAVLNLIPYIGMMIATILPMVIALATGEPSDALWVLALYAFVQFLDNNFIVPHVVASRVELNALVSIIAVMVGGAIWGVPGMFLSIPLTAMLKVIFDRVAGLEPWGFVLGDDADAPSRSLLRLPGLHLPGKVKA